MCCEIERIENMRQVLSNLFEHPTPGHFSTFDATTVCRSWILDNCGGLFVLDVPPRRCYTTNKSHCENTEH
jgi:hypothetical protein